MKNKTTSNFNVTDKNMTQKNTICVGHSEIERMKENCLEHIDPEKERKLNEKQELYDLSRKRVKNWPNTI